jgi:hypothetical protein
MDVNVVATLLGRLVAFQDEAEALRRALRGELPEGKDALEVRMLGDIAHQLETVVPALRRRVKPR